MANRISEEDLANVVLHYFIDNVAAATIADIAEGAKCSESSVRRIIAAGQGLKGCDYVRVERLSGSNFTGSYRQRDAYHPSRERLARLYVEAINR